MPCDKFQIRPNATTFQLNWKKKTLELGQKKKKAARSVGNKALNKHGQI